jgi:hypothetical protein
MVLTVVLCAVCSLAALLQFRAIADQLWSDQGRHLEVRQAAVAQLCQQPERYRDYVTTDYQQYVR